METNKTIIDNLPEAILAEILVKFPIKSITVFKVVCKRWKSQVESVVFRNLFVSLHQKSSCSWSLLLDVRYKYNARDELIALYGCVRWGLAKSLGSYISSPFLDSGIEITSYIIEATSRGLLLIVTQDDMYYVGNPLSREWVKIPPCTLSLKNYLTSRRIGLATRVDENGVVLEYKKVVVNPRFNKETNLTIQIYSSKTGEWTCENIHCPCPIPWSTKHYPEAISLNGILHWVEPGEDYRGEDAGGIIAIDLYNTSLLGEYQCWVIPFPKANFHRRACTTSRGFIMYINMASESKIKVWRLKDYYAIESEEYWQLSWEIDLAHVDYGVGSIPLVMHPFDTDVVYLWSREKCCLVSINLRKQKSTLHRESEKYSDGCIISSLEKCKSYMEDTFKRIPLESWDRGLLLSPQFLPSLWMDPVPRPPFYPCVGCGR